jgi:tetratricopeptide (TPR) repeat protein
MTSLARTWVVVAALAIAVASGAADVRAAEPDDVAEATARTTEAARLFREGELAFERRAFREAALRFEEAAALVPHAAALLNASEAWERAEELERAAADAEAVLALPGVDDASVREAKLRLARFERALGRGREGRSDGAARPRTGASRDGAGASRDDAVRGGATRGEGAVARDGATSGEGAAAGEGARARRAGEPRDDRAPRDGALDGAPDAVDARLTSSPEAALFGAPPPTLAWVAFGGAGVAAAIATTFAVSTLSAADDYDAAPTLDRADRFFERRRATNVTWAVSAALAAGGVALWALDAGDAGAPRASLTLASADGGAFVVGRLSAW